MSDYKVYRYHEDFRRHGSLESVFVATEEQVAKMKAGPTLWFHDILGKHSEIGIELDDENLKMVSEDPVVVEFIQKSGGFGVDLVGRWVDSGGEDEDEEELE